MSTEAAILGTTAINVSTSASLLGAYDNFIASGLMYAFSDSHAAINKAEEIIRKSDQKQISRERANNLLHSQVDLTAFLVWFLENYPNSVKNIKDNPNYSSHFVN